MKFDKYVAAGNDFIIINGLNSLEKDYSQLALKICNRHFGIGADGIIISQESNKADIKMVYYNSDGTEGEMCGNGIRSFAKYIYDYNIVRKKNISIETLDGIKHIEVTVDELDKVDQVKVNMGYPSLEPDKIPVKSSKDRVLEELISIDGEEYLYSAILVGVPHVVIFLRDIKDVNINRLGRKIENHSIFPRKTNVNFVEIISKGEIKIYTWERGAGRTLGCGTGSCSSVVIGNLLGKLNKKVYVTTEGGNLIVEVSQDWKIRMTGQASHVANGVFLNL